MFKWFLPLFLLANISYANDKPTKHAMSQADMVGHWTCQTEYIYDSGSKMRQKSFEIYFDNGFTILTSESTHENTLEIVHANGYWQIVENGIKYYDEAIISYQAFELPSKKPYNALFNGLMKDRMNEMNSAPFVLSMKFLDKNTRQGYRKDRDMTLYSTCKRVQS